jgi:hypothetical protein
VPYTGNACSVLIVDRENKLSFARLWRRGEGNNIKKDLTKI